LHRRGLAGRAAAHQFAQPEANGIGNAVKDAVSGTVAANQSCVEKDLQVLRNVWLISVEPVNDLADCHGTVLQRLQNTEAARFSQHLEPARHQIDHLCVHHRLIV
jgi:hypothetical protein